MTIGSTPGSADVYSSGSLGPTTKEQTVSGLPLGGQTLYVEVHRRIVDTIDSVKAQYTAAVRKGLAIITDFADRRLEDWTGPGMRSVDDVSVQLRNMEEHWAFLSRGLETMRWDIIRVQLPQPAVAGAYPDWSEFRDAVITLARQQVRTEDYDVNVDGVIDAAWLIVSSGRRRSAIRNRGDEPQCRSEPVRRRSGERQRPGRSDRQFQSRTGTLSGPAGHVRPLRHDELSDGDVVQLARPAARLQRVRTDEARMAHAAGRQHDDSRSMAAVRERTARRGDGADQQTL